MLTQGSAISHAQDKKQYKIILEMDLCVLLLG